MFALGYSFNRTGAALTLTVEAPVYVKCAPQADGSAIMDATTPIVQALPTTADGKIYIYLGLAYSATNIELQTNHPVYWHDGTGVRLWTGAVPGGGGGVNKLTLYTDSGCTNLWIDSARTTTLFASYGYSYSTAKADLTDRDIIEVWDYHQEIRYVVVRWKIDTVDDTFEVGIIRYINGTAVSGYQFDIYE